ncbi:MAG TPA: hypothetical protein VGP76_13625 [Planctomycetaceae bacterium]|nr:hypothetical protein [Planctomycetaceae bacterium]
MPLAIALLVCDEAPSRAQAPHRAPLLAKLALRYRRARSGAPLPVVWKFSWPERVVAVGALEYEVYDEQTRLGEFRIPDVVLSPGKNEFNALLPAFFVNSSASLLTVRGRFVVSGRSLDFEEQTLRVPTLYVQWFSVGVVAGAKAATPESEMRFLDKIRLETFLPPDEAQNQSATVAFDMKTADLPSDPLTLCNFDVLVLTAPGLAEVREDQAGALRKWVCAGGSLCVITGGGLEPRHAELLNDLTSESPRRAKFVVGPKGVLLPDEDSLGSILTVAKGLGRVAVLRQNLLETLSPDANPWRDTARFLLRGHKDEQVLQDTLPQFLRAKNGGVARRAQQAGVAPPVVAPARVGVWGPNSRYNNLNAVPLGHLGELFQLLMPLGVSSLPLGVIALILAAYVVTIGPIDYFLLGALRLRRYTWVLFPVVTIGFAAYTLWLSQRYLGSSDSRRAIEIYDVVPGGSVARRTRIEMLFLSQENSVETQIENGLFALVGRGNVMSRGPIPQVVSKETPETVGVEDRFPINYRIVQQIPQWRPVLNRFFWIDPKPSTIYQPAGLQGASDFDWDQPPTLTDRTGSALEERVRRAFGAKACALLLRGSSDIKVLNDLNELQHWRPSARSVVGYYPMIETVRELCQRTPEQLFKYSSALSPNGGPELDDLAVSDSTDPNETVLVIAVETESTLYLYRRVYSGSP